MTLTNVDHPGVGLLLSSNGTGMPPAVPAGALLLDPARYGTPTTTPFDASSRFDRSFTQILDDGLRFYDGTFDLAPRVNGALFPGIPTLEQRQRDG